MYLEYSYLWVEDRENQIDEFCATNPLIVEISEKFQNYEDRAKLIRELPNIHDLDAIQINMGEVFIFKAFFFRLISYFLRK